MTAGKTVFLILALLLASPALWAQSTQSIIRCDSIQHPVVAGGGMVVSQNEAASEVGRQILLDGGNAVDAAVAMGFALAEALTVMAAYPSSMAAYAKPDGSAYAAGETLIQPDLAWSLREISDHGAEAFYRGAIAEKFYSHMEQDNGLIGAEDLANYRVRERQAIATDYRGYRVVTMPPSSVGGLALLQMLNVLGHYDMARLPQGSTASLHMLAEMMKLGNANRREGIGDTDFVEVPIAGILGESTTSSCNSSSIPWTMA